MPKARTLLTPTELDEMGAEAEARKDKLKAKAAKDSKGKTPKSDPTAPRLALAGAAKGSASRR